MTQANMRNMTATMLATATIPMGVLQNPSLFMAYHPIKKPILHMTLETLILNAEGSTLLRTGFVLVSWLNSSNAVTYKKLVHLMKRTLK